MMPLDLLGNLGVVAKNLGSGDTLTALVSVLIGALIAGMFTVAGLLIRSKFDREHWLRQERLRAYVEVARINHEVQATWREVHELKAKVDELEKAAGDQKGQPSLELPEVKRRLSRVGKRAEGLLTQAYSAAPPFSILGPPALDDAASAIVAAIRNPDDPDGFHQAQTAFTKAAQKALGIR